MACNAIATARAKVNLDLPATLAGLLTADTAEKLLLAYGKQLNGDAYAFTAGDRINVYAGYWQLQYSLADGSLTVSSKWATKKQVAELNQQVAAYLKKAAGKLLQARVAALAGKLGNVTDRQQAGNSLVITLEI